ncbi:hypothetical protein COV49_02455 [Candidatus Falkowbacteria bacterium CG11_big_fil_rev_8_21_14_0_20_39_10]|uniref:Uncharacterized protein n=1 Tax=Candidatus Falkowbacteria bacterium CG11_big_fil_rev_8_21_14_0_20_39_10 TaxID=1974570 RepID=A0A2M6K8Z9_9BACT|nr:MAG: hypothetical protein COV49_02455 [Candidatus Falkowbacteria bacterium CG11_big_fil_rev_8_21_14_0_20_39_10]
MPAPPSGARPGIGNPGDSRKIIFKALGYNPRFYGSPLDPPVKPEDDKKRNFSINFYGKTINNANNSYSLIPNV